VCDTIFCLVCPPASQGNINKFADGGISWTLFSPVPNSALVQCAQDTLISKGLLQIKALVTATGLRWQTYMTVALDPFDFPVKGNFL